ncbi:interferon-induced, double-stranded RNA-activated protein kinase isoform X1 [Scleropages formosus]|uniref:non-specific serine/threonine protein kinase n=2 Tax=Scleropages formosus TaxID=113540 RepID=A0A8C9V160_SCLFO|nr:interferon-induced, double-stranded RNA-activated protein kinase-like isoform X1 [Scleropages formosus]
MLYSGKQERDKQGFKEMDGLNYIAQLNEYSQKLNQMPKYEEISVEGPAHSRRFTMRVVLNNETYSEGEGRNKKEAKQQAAKKALEQLFGDSMQLNDSVTSASACPSATPGSFTQANYICWLNEYGQKQNLTVTPKEFTRFAPANATQGCRFIVGNKEYPEAFGSTKKEAKEEAARLVHQELFKEVSTKDEVSSSVASEREDDSSQSTSGFFEKKNYKGFLNEYCQKNKLVHDFKVVDKHGPPHNPQFFSKVIINKKEYPEGQGKTRKEAEQNAAQNAWFELLRSLDQNSQVSVGSRTDSPSFLNESESQNHGSLLACGDTSSDFITFRDSKNPTSPKESTPGAKSKRKLAVNFNLSPDEKKQENNNLENSAEKTATQSRFLHDYDSISRIGKGGFGQVFKARRKIEKCFFAVKIVKSTDKALREVGALVTLRHPNIVQYFSSWKEDTGYQIDSSESSSQSESGSSVKYLYIQMEFCDKGTLRLWINEQNTKVTPTRRNDALNIFRQVVQGVEEIHTNGLIHRDLKPVNILFGNDGKVKIGDFGLVTCSEDEGDEALLQRTKRTGTFSYMSPEQESSCNYDKKVDIFSLGLIYFELLWRTPETRMEWADVWKQVRNQHFPQYFCECYSTEHKLIERMLSEKPEKRPDASMISKMLVTFGGNMGNERETPREMRSV